MKSGKAFELLVRHIMINIGFEEVTSDDLYIFGKPTCQKINGLGEAHDADVLLEPPVQTPFWGTIRLLIECKDFSKRKKRDKVGLGIIRSALGLRNDINSFEAVDINELQRRKAQKRELYIHHQRHIYNVAVASATGFADQAQSMAATHRIPLIDFCQYPFWNEWEKMMNGCETQKKEDDEIFNDIIHFARRVCENMTVAVTNTGRLIFLYSISGEIRFPYDSCGIDWNDINGDFFLTCGDARFYFNLSDTITQRWDENELDIRRTNVFGGSGVPRMIVYFRENNKPVIKMLSIDLEKMEPRCEKISYEEIVNITKEDSQSK